MTFCPHCGVWVALSTLVDGNWDCGRLDDRSFARIDEHDETGEAGA